MADTMDRRSEGKACDSEGYSRYKRFEAAGLCSYCGKKPVKDRKVCYKCSEKTVVYGRQSAFRRILKDCGVKDYDMLKSVMNDAIEAYERSLGVQGMFAQLDRLDTMYSLRYAVMTAAPRTKKGKKNGKV